MQGSGGTPFAMWAPTNSTMDSEPSELDNTSNDEIREVCACICQFVYVYAMLYGSVAISNSGSRKAEAGFA